MDFGLTEKQHLPVEGARALVRRELVPKAASWDRDHHFPVEVIRAAAEQGYLGLYVAEEDSDPNPSQLPISLIFEQLAAGCVVAIAYINIHNMAAWMLASFGDTALKEAWLSGLVSGGSFVSYYLTEPDVGSDATCLYTRARREGDEYVLDSSKCFVSGAGNAQVLVVMMCTDEDDARGIPCFLMPADALGIHYGRNENRMGWRAQSTRTITFESVYISAGNRIGPEGQGFVYTVKGLGDGRLNIASYSLGTAQTALEQPVCCIEEREQLGKPLTTFQALQFKLAGMLIELTASRQMVHLDAHRLDHGDTEATLYCIMARRFATDRYFDVYSEALQLHGGYGYLSDYPLERQIRDIRIHRILEGTNEIMRMIVARCLLKQDGMLSRLL